MLRLIISCTRSWNFAWHLWCWTTDSKNIVKLLVTSQTIHILCCQNDYFVKGKFKLFNNNPFPNSLGPLFQNEVKCSDFDMEMIFHSHQINLIFTREVVHFALFWKWGFLELESGLFVWHNVPCFSKKIVFLLTICLPCVICGSYVTKINAV